jgi:hypothetical protein
MNQRSVDSVPARRLGSPAVLARILELPASVAIWLGWRRQEFVPTRVVLRAREQAGHGANFRMSESVVSGFRGVELEITEREPTFRAAAFLSLD